MDEDAHVLLLLVLRLSDERKGIRRGREFLAKLRRGTIRPVLELIDPGLVTRVVGQIGEILSQFILLHVTIGDHPVFWHMCLLFWF